MNIYIYIHICCINNWKNIFFKLYSSIKTSGLYNIIKGIKCNVLSLNNIDLDFFNDLNDSKIEILGIHKNFELYETPTINLLYDHSLKEDFYVLYIHTKGVKHNDKNINVLDWINYLIYFNIQKYDICIKSLIDYDTVGVNLYKGDENTPIHYSGNFWWSKSEYIKKLEKCIYTKYISPEVWLTEKNIGRYLSLWNSNINHYNERYEEHNYIEKYSNKNITIGYLSWKRNDIFMKTLESHKKNGLFEIIPPENRIIFFQEISKKDKELASKYESNYIGNKDNIGILNAFIELVEACKTPYFIFCENDWNLIEDINKTKNIIEDSINLLENNRVDIIRLRHRKYPGEPLYSKPKNIDEWLKNDISLFPYKLESLSWLENPNNNYNNLLEEYNGNNKWYITSLDHQRWSNNIFIGKTDYIKNNIIELIKQFKSSNNKYTGLEDVLINSNKYLGKDTKLDEIIKKLSKMRLAGGNGLFMHKDYV